MTTDFRVQQLFGQPVLTWWQGYASSGSGTGSGYIYDASYRQQYVVHAGNGLSMDSHEFFITNAGQAWVIAVSPVHLGGVPRVVYDGSVQEIDIKTGLVLFEWHALDHINPAESYRFGPNVPGRILDPYHLNSVALDSDGNPIVSGRDTSAIYKIDRATGVILWRLGGKKSSFKMGPGTTTAFQHDAIVQPDGSLTVFDDGTVNGLGPQLGPPTVHQFSRGAKISLDFTHMTASLVTEYDHSPNILADFEGSMQTLGDGEVILGWGQQPYFSEASVNGTQDFDARFTSATASYRAYRFKWSAQPPTAPAVAISPHPDGSMGMYMSWNGATTVASWRILTGADSRSLRAVGTVPASGFETAINVHSGNPSFAAQALGTGGQVLATTHPAGAPQRLAIYGQSAFVWSGSGFGGIPVSCFAAKPCQIVVSVSSGRTLVAHSGSQALGRDQTGLLFFRLSRSAQATLAHNHRINVSVTAQSSVGFEKHGEHDACRRQHERRRAPPELDIHRGRGAPAARSDRVHSLDQRRRRAPRGLRVDDSVHGVKQVDRRQPRDRANRSGVSRRQPSGLPAVLAQRRRQEPACQGAGEPARRPCRNHRHLKRQRRHRSGPLQLSEALRAGRVIECSSLGEPLRLDLGRGVDGGQVQLLFAGRRETVRSACRSDHDVAGARLERALVELEPGGPGVDHEHLGVAVAVQAGARAGKRVDQEQRHWDRAVLGSGEDVGARAARQAAALDQHVRWG